MKHREKELDRAYKAAVEAKHACNGKGDIKGYRTKICESLIHITNAIHLDREKFDSFMKKTNLPVWSRLSVKEYLFLFGCLYVVSQLPNFETIFTFLMKFI